MKDEKPNKAELYLNDELIGVSFNAAITGDAVETSATGEDKEIIFEGLLRLEPEDINRYQFYLKRSGRYYLRNAYGDKISFSGDDPTGEVLSQLKRGEWYNCEFGVE
jgi:hypothetical protein